MKKHFFDYLFVCHKMPSRSFFFKGKQFPICARCTGMFVGYIIVLLHILLHFIFRELIFPPIYMTFLFFVPAALDGGIQYFTSYESGNWRRLFTGIFAGLATIYLFVNIIQLANSHALYVIEQLNNR